MDESALNQLSSALAYRAARRASDDKSRKRPMTNFIGFCIAAGGVLLWLIGGNVLVAYHYKRRGMPMESGFHPFAYPFKHFNGREWLVLALLGTASLTMFGFALGWR